MNTRAEVGDRDESVTSGVDASTIDASTVEIEPSEDDTGEIEPFDDLDQFMEELDEADDTLVTATSLVDHETGTEAATARTIASRAASPSSPPTRRRPSKWDRPPEPRDWRFFVGHLGRIMLATGVLMLGFVAYQLWGTGIQTARAQNALEEQFTTQVIESANDARIDELLERATSSGLIDSGDSVDAPPSSIAAEAATADEPGQDADTATPAESSALNPDDAISARDAIDLSEQAVEQAIPEIERGDVLARLEIPRIDQDVYVVPGVDIDDLKSGPGHYPDTPLPGQLGNAAIAGHRTTYGSPFFDVDQLQPGDEIKVTMLTGDQFVYEVTGISIVEANDYWVVSTTDPDTAELTLTSCHPKYTAQQRIVVHSVLNPEKSANVGFPTSYELDDDVETPIVVDDPLIASGDTVADDQVADVQPPTDEEADTIVEIDGDEPSVDIDEQDPADTAAPIIPDETPVQQAGIAAGDEFGRGWFDDTAAWPQIILWGLGLILVAIAAHRLSRRMRRDWVGALAGFAPFVVMLYFFFQNVHRLLPPGI